MYDGAETDKAAKEAFFTKNYHGLAGHRTTDNAKDFAGASCRLLRRLRQER